jgi:hypothetical protein
MHDAARGGEVVGVGTKGHVEGDEGEGARVDIFDVVLECGELSPRDLAPVMG